MNLTNDSNAEPDVVATIGDPALTRLLYLRELWGLRASPEIPRLLVSPGETTTAQGMRDLESQWIRAWNSAWDSCRSLNALLRSAPGGAEPPSEPEPLLWHSPNAPGGFDLDRYASWLADDPTPELGAWQSEQVAAALVDAGRRGLWGVYVLPVTGSWSQVVQQRLVGVSRATFEDRGLLLDVLGAF